MRVYVYGCDILQVSIESTSLFSCLHTLIYAHSCVLMYVRTYVGLLAGII